MVLAIILALLVAVGICRYVGEGRSPMGERRAVRNVRNAQAQLFIWKNKTPAGG